jgi:hypothetical protein
MRGSSLRWFYLVSFVAALLICAILTSILIFGFANHLPHESRMVLFILPQLVLFGGAARVMFRSFKRA